MAIYIWTLTLPKQLAFVCPYVNRQRGNGCYHMLITRLVFIFFCNFTQYLYRKKIGTGELYNITANILILNKEFLSFNLVISPHTITTL